MSKAASKGQACLRPACGSRGFRRPPPSDSTKEKSVQVSSGRRLLYKTARTLFRRTTINIQVPRRTGTGSSCNLLHYTINDVHFVHVNSSCISSQNFASPLTRCPSSSLRIVLGLLPLLNCSVLVDRCSPGLSSAFIQASGFGP